MKRRPFERVTLDPLLPCRKRSFKSRGQPAAIKRRACSSVARARRIDLVSNHPLQRFTAWLCLVAAVFMGMGPAQAFVLCFDPHGAVALEAAAADGRCGGCAAVDASSTTAHSASEDHSDCPCTDIPLVIGSDEAKLRPSPIEFDHHAIATVSAEISPTVKPLGEACPSRVRPHEPRVPPVLALIRTVVLRV